jgi:hypothetical protein
MKVIDRLLTEHGIEADAETRSIYKEAIGNVINKTDETNAAFWNPETMESTVTTAFNVVAQKLINPVLRAAGVESLAKVKERREATLARAPVGGTPQMRDEDDAFSSKHPTGSPEWREEWKTWSNRKQDSILDHYGVGR